ncbi:hypothetical protein K8374_17870 [Pseudomonas sp. p1(2021b)]|uniref:hypothetical protein n=1 Tax=Pseudomonas sp. p1(2021b) TaxID=2874628 RepID=UPI001CCD0504|nr:hypothetical protein [Pseudomonas sp. p1(2021b)]UBM24224.1 hypothetical protein K8374_17870 [Pseudomonas sp. p1(2021b)]
MINADELEALRRDADRYRWLRKHAVRIQGSQLWYAGMALDIRVDVGRDRMADQAKPIQEGGMLLLRHQPD